MAEARAPGKLLLTGEYAVLDGAPAVTVAIGGPARAIALVADAWRLRDPVTARASGFRLKAPDHVRWEDALADEQAALPTAVLAECLRRWPDALQQQPLELCLDTSAFVQVVGDRPRKLGLGSSAALVVALFGAVSKACRLQVPPAEMRAGCLAAHRAFQQGRGSGVDVLTAIGGGLLICRPVDRDLRAETLRWPTNLYLVVVWTGRSASTPALISRYEDFRVRQPKAFARECDRLSDAAERAGRAWRNGLATDILDAVADYAQRVRTMDRAGSIGICTPEHEAYARLAAEAGAVYKSSGAGGGDLGFALTDSVDVAARFRAAVAAAGGHVLDLAPGRAGLSVT